MCKKTLVLVFSIGSVLILSSVLVEFKFSGFSHKLFLISIFYVIKTAVKYLVKRKPTKPYFNSIEYSTNTETKTEFFYHLEMNRPQLTDGTTFLELFEEQKNEIQTRV